MTSNHEKPGFIIHLGAGHCQELDDYLAADATKIVLVEPHPERAAHLERLTRDQSHITIVQKAISDRKELKTLFEYNLPGFSSLRRPTHLKRLYPGIRVKEKNEVEVTTLDSLLRDLDPPQNCKKSLVVDAPGEEHGVLESLMASGNLELFESVVFYASKTPLYEEGRDSDYLLQELAWLGYVLDESTSEVHTDRPRWVMRRSVRAINYPALEFYNQQRGGIEGPGADPFILLDSKSLPRSGLHFLKRSLGRVLGQQLSFCEWYQEPGCCKKSPCALRAYSERSAEDKQFRLRLVKSHDFGFSDPVLSASENVQRVVLVRDPLFVLTSWFSLDQLRRFTCELEPEGISMRKIWYSHEKDVLISAYKIVDRNYEGPSVDVLEAWLDEKARFIAGFIRKWVLPELESASPYVHLVQYEEIDEFVGKLLRPYATLLSEQANKQLTEIDGVGSKEFNCRSSPVQSTSASISAYLSENLSLFEGAARRVNYWVYGSVEPPS